jgi:penicillin-binding protein 2
MASRFTLKDHFRESRLINGRLLFAAFLSVLVFSAVFVRLVVL